MSSESKHLRVGGGPRRYDEHAVAHVGLLRPALADIPTACRYLGDLSRSRLYELLPGLDVIKIGARTFVTVESLDRLIAAHQQTSAR
jgi:hypothetical protein